MHLRPFCDAQKESVGVLFACSGPAGHPSSTLGTCSQVRQHAQLRAAGSLAFRGAMPLHGGTLGHHPSHLLVHCGSLALALAFIHALPVITSARGNMADHNEEELLDYEEDEVEAGAGDAGKGADGAKKGYVGIHSTSFKDFLLKVRDRGRRGSACARNGLLRQLAILQLAGGARDRPACQRALSATSDLTAHPPRTRPTARAGEGHRALRLRAPERGCVAGPGGRRPACQTRRSAARGSGCTRRAPCSRATPPSHAVHSAPPFTADPEHPLNPPLAPPRPHAQCNTSASPRRSWATTCCARPSPAWARQRCS